MIRDWDCPSCGLEHRSTQPGNFVPVHACPALRGLQAHLELRRPGGGRPRGRHVLVEREDYVGRERGLVSVDGKVLSAIKTERPDGSNDLVILAPSAVADTDIQ